MQREHAAPIDHAQQTHPDIMPLNPVTMLGNIALRGRGNAPVQTALLQQMQHTHGNRATQRFLQRTPPPTAISFRSTEPSLQRDVATTAPRTKARARGGGVTFRLNSGAQAYLGAPVWHVTLIITNAPERFTPGRRMQDERFEEFVDACQSGVKSILGLAGKMLPKPRPIQVKIHYRRGAVNTAYDEARTGALRSLGIDESKIKREPTAKEQLDTRLQEIEKRTREDLSKKYEAEAEMARAEGGRNFGKLEMYKMQNVQDKAKFLFWAEAQHKYHFAVDVFKQRAKYILKEGVIPWSKIHDIPSNDLKAKLDLTLLWDEARKQARVAGEQEYEAYRQRAERHKKRSGEFDWADWDARPERRAEWQATLKKRYKGDLAGEKSKLREEFGDIRGDLLKAQIDADSMRGEAMRLLPDLQEVVKKWGKANEAMIRLEASMQSGLTQEGRQEASEAVVSFSYAVYDLGLKVAVDRKPDGGPMEAYKAHIHAQKRDSRQYVDAILMSTRGLGKQLTSAKSHAQWKSFFTKFNKLARDMDTYIEKRLRASQEQTKKQQDPDNAEEVGLTADQLSHASSMSASLENLRAEHPEAQRITAVFYPREQFENMGAPGDPQFRAKGIPWVFYLYRERGPNYATRLGLDLWTLVDMTSPHKHKANSEPVKAGKGAPVELYKELNSKLRFPKGELWVQGTGGGEPLKVETTEPWRVSEFLAYVGLAAAGTALAIASMGTSVPATVIVIGGVAGAGAAVAEMLEKAEHGMLENKDIAVNVLSIVGSLASVGGTLGKVVLSPAMKLRFPQLAAHAGKLQVPLRITELGSDVASFGVLVDEVWTQYKVLADNKTLSDSEKKAAQMRLLSSFMLQGGMSIISIKGNLKGNDADAYKGKDLHLGSDSPSKPSGGSVKPDIGGPSRTGIDPATGQIGSKPDLASKPEPKPAAKVDTVGSRGEPHELKLLPNGRVCRHSDPPCLDILISIRKRSADLRQGLPPSSDLRKELADLSEESKNLYKNPKVDVLAESKKLEEKMVKLETHPVSRIAAHPSLNRAQRLQVTNTLENMRKHTGATDADLDNLVKGFPEATGLANVTKELTDALKNTDPVAKSYAMRDVIERAVKEGKSTTQVIRSLRGSKRAAGATRSEWQNIFKNEHKGSVGFQQGSETKSVTEIKVDISSGSTKATREIKITEYDLNHYQQGHTFENYAFQPININRAAASSMWAPGTSVETILAHARLSVHSLQNEIKNAIANGNTWLRHDVQIGGYTYNVGIDLRNNKDRLTQFYPKAGSHTVPVPKADLTAIKTALGK